MPASSNASSRSAPPQASAKLSQAAAVLSGEPGAMTLCYLQTLNEIAAEQNSTIVFPLPIDLLGLMPGAKH